MLECLPVENITEESADSDYKVIVFDGIAVVNKINKKKMKLKLCSEFCISTCTENGKRSSRI